MDHENSKDLKDRDYLGDSVYVGHDGYHVVLFTWNGDSPPSNVIALDADVRKALDRYIKRIGNAVQ